MDDRNTPQFTIGELLNALEGVKKEVRITRSAMVEQAARITRARDINDAEDLEHHLDWIGFEARRADAMQTRVRQVETAIRTINKFVKYFK